MITLSGAKAPHGGVLTLADQTAPVVVPSGSRLLTPADEAEIARYVAGTAAYYDANELCRR